ncbi:uncharacterized protein LOC114523653 [Dendronephthya gigantea]|uniref:uncharacterized protein LOC114523653 n=1 Tax=Dendronephthya gigantea TaxID=151771 RepID=UPI00106B41AB|nr:uncharacterized protein LOC114523653 [Dendronephthya gigantea]
MAKIILRLFVCGALLYSCIYAYSSRSQDLSSSRMQQNYPKNNFQLTLLTTCRDRLPRCNKPGYCEKYNTRRWKKVMRMNCKRTCNHCPAPSPPACFSSQYGCCWDYITSALGPGGKGCPPCNDNRRYPYVCRRFKTYCRRKGISGKWMRGNCPDSCGHCAIWQF